MLKSFWLSQFNNGLYYGRKILECYRVAMVDFLSVKCG